MSLMLIFKIYRVSIYIFNPNYLIPLPRYQSVPVAEVILAVELLYVCRVPPRDALYSYLSSDHHIYLI